MGFWKGRGRLTLLQKEQGAFDLKKVKPLGVSKVKDRAIDLPLSGSASEFQFLDEPFISITYNVVRFHFVRSFVHLALLGFRGGGE
jgi:hypothetical protein